MVTTGSRGPTMSLAIADDSQIAEARRRLATFAQHLGLDDTARGRIAIVATELATNLLLHGGGGHLLCRGLAEPRGLELLAVDGGRGMEDVEECLRDGFSTNGTAGNGLGAVRRLADAFDVHSDPGRGTVVMAQFLWDRSAQAPRFVVGAVCLPVAGEEECGDAWLVQVAGERLRVLVADGLGHGTDAALAALAALRAAEASSSAPPARVLEQVHRAIAASRGTAMAVCDIDVDAGRVAYAGVGNIAGVLVQGPGQQRSMISHNGIVGHQLRKAQEFAYPWTPGTVLVMHSDGLQSRWSLDAYPGIARRHPSVIAAVLHRDSSRGRDDVVVVVVKEAG